MLRCCEPSITVVQSIPVGNFSVPPVAGSLPTWTALATLANSSKHTLDVTAMYVDLLGTEDRKIYTPQQMKAFGADNGVAVFDAVKAAAVRGVAIRLLLGTLNNPINSSEVRQLLQYPNVQARTWDPTPWYGGGIMHAKLWISDGERAYLGSANSDWKSLSQVKELGVLAEHSAPLASDVGHLFDAFWLWAGLSPAGRTTHAWSDTYLAELMLPVWDDAVPAAQRQMSPFADQRPSLSTPYSLASPLKLELPGAPSASGFISGSPDGVLLPTRTRDEDVGGADFDLVPPGTYRYPGRRGWIRNGHVYSRASRTGAE